MTTAAAQGNASALINVIESSPPEVCPFDMVLTPEMELLHFINNEDIMEHAEEMQEALEANASSAARYAGMNDRQRTRHGSGIPHAIRRREARIIELEELILAEIDEAQNEYRMLAHALCEGRQEYIEARAVVGLAPITQSEQRVMNRTGRNNSRPEMTRQNMHEVLEFERYHDAYKLLESGFAHVTTREQITSILSFIGRELMIEIVTLGLAKYVRAVRAAATALDRAADALRAAGKAVVVSRYQRLSPAIRERLNNLYRRRQPDRQQTHPRDGETVEGRPGQAARPRCVAGACAL